MSVLSIKKSAGKSCVRFSVSIDILESMSIAVEKKLNGLPYYYITESLEKNISMTELQS